MPDLIVGPGVSPDCLATAELAAFVEQYAGLAALDPQLGAEVVELGSLTVLRTPDWPDHPWANAAVAVGEVIAGDLDEALALLSGTTAPYVSVSGEHGAAVLASRGLAPTATLARWAAPARELGAETELRIEQVGPHATWQVSEVLRLGFAVEGMLRWWRAPLGRPGWAQFVAYDAYDADEAVATAALHLEPGSSTAHLCGAATVPQARGRGAQSALLAERTSLAARLGATHVTAKAAAGSASSRNLERTGFAVAGHNVRWRPRP